MEHINKECKQVMGSLGPNIRDKAVSWICRSTGELTKVSQQFDYVNNHQDESGCHPRRSVQLDIMEKVLTQLQDDSVYDYVSGRKHSKFKKIRANMT